MKLKLLLFTTICLFICSLKAFAQADTTKRFNDYIINLNNDTIKCEIGHKFSNGKFIYNINGIRGSQTLKSDSVKEYYLSSDSGTFIAKHLPSVDRLIFLQLLERGKINLFQLSIQSGGNSTTLSSGYSMYWYASKGDDSLKLIKMYRGAISFGSKYIGNTSHKKRQQALVDMFADSPYLLKSFNRALKTQEYDYDLIRNYIQAYNLSSLANKKTKE